MDSNCEKRKNVKLSELKIKIKIIGWNFEKFQFCEIIGNISM